ncbi:MAG: hypothetical protein QNJ72_41700 [Pleurocapsa sp. MO_226.B13]|nr:hypothetical protein [Pleurocapsa sp. MO_226.B13]
MFGGVGNGIITELFGEEPLAGNEGRDRFIISIEATLIKATRR